MGTFGKGEIRVSRRRREEFLDPSTTAPPDAREGREGGETEDVLFVSLVGSQVVIGWHQTGYRRFLGIFLFSLCVHEEGRRSIGEWSSDVRGTDIV